MSLHCNCFPSILRLYLCISPLTTTSHDEKCWTESKWKNLIFPAVNIEQLQQQLEQVQERPHCVTLSHSSRVWHIVYTGILSHILVKYGPQTTTAVYYALLLYWIFTKISPSFSFSSVWLSTFTRRCNELFMNRDVTYCTVWPVCWIFIPDQNAAKNKYSD